MLSFQHLDMPDFQVAISYVKSGISNHRYTRLRDSFSYVKSDISNNLIDIPDYETLSSS